ncbi:MAG TPA: OmpA family protein [Puia sp.]|nr:OmpA family protein [Puia sp.]
MKIQHFCTAILSSCILLSCVSNKKFAAMQAAAQKRFDSLSSEYSKVQNALKSCTDQTTDLTTRNTALQGQVDDMTKQMALLKENNTQALKQLQDLSVISSTQAESIKKSLENIGAKDVYITDLQKEMARKDSLNMALVMNLKGAIGNMDDQDINIKVDKGVVFIDISDKLLFKSGKYDITSRASEVLGKVATVLKAQPDIEFMVEGHTDNVAYKHPPLMDNWDLSVKRATAVVRVLQNKYGLPPAHMTAAGRSEYINVASNDTPEGRAANRRTRIVILPQLDQFFKLLEPGNK